MLLKDMLAEKENDIQKEIDQKIAQHRNWNNGYLDFTRMPLTPVSEHGCGASFRTAVTEYLPTPPASASSEASGGADHADVGSPSRAREDAVTVRYASPTYDRPSQNRPSFRRRIGRGGRVMVDRRGLHLQSKEGIDPRVTDRFKFDQDDEEDQAVYLADQFDTLSMRYRASIFGSHHSAHRAAQAQAARNSALEASAAKAQAVNGRPSSGQGPPGVQRPAAQMASGT